MSKLHEYFRRGKKKQKKQLLKQHYFIPLTPVTQRTTLEMEYWQFRRFKRGANQKLLLNYLCTISDIETNHMYETSNQRVLKDQQYDAYVQ